MNKNKEKFPLGLILVLVLIGCLFIACFAIFVHSELTKEYVTIEGKIVDTKFRTDWIGANQRDILTITMDDNSTYDILIRDEYYDFTVNSYMFIKLVKTGGNTVWEIEHIVKVPSKP